MFNFLSSRQLFGPEVHIHTHKHRHFFSKLIVFTHKHINWKKIETRFKWIKPICLVSVGIIFDVSQPTNDDPRAHQKKRKKRRMYVCISITLMKHLLLIYLHTNNTKDLDLSFFSCTIQKETFFNKLLKFMVIYLLFRYTHTHCKHYHQI